MKRVLLTILFLIIIAGCSDPIEKLIPPVVVKPLYDEKFNQKELTIAKKAFEVFAQTCRPLMGEYAGDIETIEITSYSTRCENGDCADYRCDDYGWDRSIYIKVKIKDRTNLIPVVMRAFGHTLHFYLGGPENPGITTTKFPQLCGVQNPSNGSDAFISVPNLKSILTW